MSKNAYQYYSYAHFQATGHSYDILIVPDDYTPGPGITLVAPPEDMLTPKAVLFFDPVLQVWADYGQEAQIIAAQKQANDLEKAQADVTTAKADAATAKQTADAAKDGLDQLNSAVMEIADYTFSMAPAAPTADTQKEETPDA